MREIVENTQSQISALTAKCETLDRLAREAEANLAATKQDLQRVLPFEREVKEKNLLIGKLRHEAVTLNDHLRKALRMLKRDNADDKIDKQLVTNVLLQFVSLQRGDAKKYEVLQLIASVLDWTDGAICLSCPWCVVLMNSSRAARESRATAAGHSRGRGPATSWRRRRRRRWRRLLLC